MLTPRAFRSRAVALRHARLMAASVRASLQHRGLRVYEPIQQILDDMNPAPTWDFKEI